MKVNLMNNFIKGLSLKILITSFKMSLSTKIIKLKKNPKCDFLKYIRLNLNLFSIKKLSESGYK